MSRLEITLSGILTLSLLFNVGVFIYARAAIVRLLSVSEELGDLNQMVNSFASHLKTVYELDSFYGDHTLSHLLQHAISFNEQLETFEYIYSLTEDENLETPEEEIENEKTEESEET
jgi:hypothetical protein